VHDVTSEGKRDSRSGTSTECSEPEMQSRTEEAEQLASGGVLLRQDDMDTGRFRRQLGDCSRPEFKPSVLAGAYDARRCKRSSHGRSTPAGLPSHLPQPGETDSPVAEESASSTPPQLIGAPSAWKRELELSRAGVRPAARSRGRRCPRHLLHWPNPHRDRSGGASRPAETERPQR
jgi:hypothetical protein